MIILMKIPSATQWFLFEDHDSIELALSVMEELGIRELRTLFSWADWEREGGPAWFDRMVESFQRKSIVLVPALFYTPIPKARIAPGEAPKTSFPPKRLEDFADFVGEMIARYGTAFEWMQLWNEANWDVYWNWEKDPGWKLFAEMMRGSMAIAKRRGKKVVLGGLSPYEAGWVNAMFDHGVMQEGDALGIHAFPGTWDTPAENWRRRGRPWRGLAQEVADARAHLRRRGSRGEIWLTETGYSTYGEGAELKERSQGQIDYFEELLWCDADRIFWHSIIDQKKGTPTDNELNAGMGNDDKAYHFGIVDEYGAPKPLYPHWQKTFTERS